ncbi:hypothetical protein A2G07_14980 (plasmid) [Deinococcus radiodurans R1 = ATCC 13939 = DSM 20539]|nr:hypothetical protein A2G07_14980 [Deinococcus radiodurans R1 = ATCC 13939 = DSM 20539]
MLGSCERDTAFFIELPGFLQSTSITEVKHHSVKLRQTVYDGRPQLGCQGCGVQPAQADDQLIADILGPAVWVEDNARWINVRGRNATGLHR